MLKYKTIKKLIRIDTSDVPILISFFIWLLQNNSQMNSYTIKLELPGNSQTNCFSRIYFSKFNSNHNHTRNEFKLHLLSSWTSLKEFMFLGLRLQRKFITLLLKVKYASAPYISSSLWFCIPLRFAYCSAASRLRHRSGINSQSVFLLVIPHSYLATLLGLIAAFHLQLFQLTSHSIWILMNNIATAAYYYHENGEIINMKDADSGNPGGQFMKRTARNFSVEFLYLPREIMSCSSTFEITRALFYSLDP